MKTVEFSYYVKGVESATVEIDDDVDFSTMTPEQAGEVLREAISNREADFYTDVLESELPHTVIVFTEDENDNGGCEYFYLTENNV